MVNPLETAHVGGTGIEVSRMGLGASPLGHLFGAILDTQAEETVRYALNCGIQFIDTAPMYGQGLSERRLGKALADAPRPSYVLATKVGRLLTEGGDLVFDFSREGILRSLEGSLNRLQLESVDIVHIHDPDHHYQEALDVAFPTLAELRSQGVIRAIGAGMNQWQILADCARQADFDCFLLAGRYTLLEQESLDFLSLPALSGL